MDKERPMIQSLMVATGSNTCFADDVNSKFKQSARHYVDVKDRLDECLRWDNYQIMIQDAIKQWKINNYSIQSWDDVILCTALTGKLADIVVDTTLQRPVNIRNVKRIMNDFVSMKVAPIFVYKDDVCPGKYICWDGQHTVITLYLIACQIFNMGPADVEIPIVIFPADKKWQVREICIGRNTVDQQPFDACELWHQYVYGVRIDHNTKHQHWLETELKQQYLENAKMFVTKTEYGDIFEPGAYSRFDELFKYSPAMVEIFTKYFDAVCGSNRPVQPKESFIMFKLFAWLRKTNRLTDTMIDDIAAVIDKIGLNHEKGFITLFEHTKDCYGRYYENLNGWKMGIRYSEEHLCITFLRAQFVKEGIDVPDYYAAVWPVADEDLL